MCVADRRKNITEIRFSDLWHRSSASFAVVTALGKAHVTCGWFLGAVQVTRVSLWLVPFRGWVRTPFLPRSAWLRDAGGTDDRDPGSSIWPLCQMCQLSGGYSIRLGLYWSG